MPYRYFQKREKSNKGMGFDKTNNIMGQSSTLITPDFSILNPVAQRYKIGEIVDASHGTIVVDVLDNARAPTGAEVVFSLDGSDGDSLYLFKTTSNGGVWRVAQNLNGSEQFRYNHNYRNMVNGRNRFVFVWDDNDFRFYINGDLVYNRTSFTAPDNFSRGIALGLFGNNDGLPYTTGTVTRAEYYTEALSDNKASFKGRNNSIIESVTRNNNLTIVKQGQSNSMGTAVGSPVYTNASQMKMIGNDLVFKDYSDPYDDNTNAVFDELSDGNAGIGSAGYTADILAGRLNQDITVMGLNKSSTSMTDDWNPFVSITGGFVSGQRYLPFIQGLKVASQYSDNIYIESWQGESDAYAAVSQSDYEDAFRDFIQQTHNAMGKPMNWIVLGLHDWHSDLSASASEAEWNAITTARQNVANEFPTATFVSLSGVEGDASDRLHLNATGHQEVALRVSNVISPQ